MLYQQWDTRASMHIFNDDGCLPGKRSLRCCRHLSIAVFVTDNRCQKNATRQRHQDLLLWDHDDLTRLQIQLYEALGERAICVFPPRIASKCCRWAAIKGCIDGADPTFRFIVARLHGLGDAMNDREMLGSVGSGFIMGMRCRNCARSSRIYR